eukprot:3558057-Rhodomonas_salina.1
MNDLPVGVVVRFDESRLCVCKLSHLQHELRQEYKGREGERRKRGTGAVSYTHLTLPTICSV